MVHELPLSRCYSKLDDACKLDLRRLGVRHEPRAILMCDPSQFAVVDVKNAFMEGNINRTDSKAAYAQWEALRLVFERLGYPVDVVKAKAGCEDMVFTANQVLLGEHADGHKWVVLANMVYPSRRREVPDFAKWFKARGYEIIPAPAAHFEGQGDALWHPGRCMFWGGWGHRTEYGAYPGLVEKLNVPAITLKLVHPKFYHLDTAFCPLGKDVVIYYPKAFDDEGNKLINHFFKGAIMASDADAENFACNALALGKHVVLQRGSHDVCAALRERGFNPIEVETSEFMKSGGSVSCLKMLTYEHGSAGHKYGCVSAA